MRTESTIKNAVVRIVMAIIPSLLGIIVNNLIISTYGSDLNGVVATISQVINFLTLFEGGFSLAANVYLYKPYLDNDIEKVVNVLSGVRNIYRKISILIFLVGILLSVITPFFIKSEIDYFIIMGLFLIILVNLVVNFFFLQHYFIIFGTAQKDYVINIVSLVLRLLSQSCTILFVVFKLHIILVFSIPLLLTVLIQLPVIRVIYYKYFPLMTFKSNKPDYSVIKQTKDVFFQKLADLVYKSTDLILLSLFVNTKTASVYAVYNMIFTFIKSIILALIISPFNAFGQMFVTGDLKRFREVFKIYQVISFVIINIFLTTTIVLTMPFLTMYTKNFSDQNYINFVFVILFSLYAVGELISYMLGMIGNATGHFKDMKNITIIVTIINMLVSLVLIKWLGIAGVLLGSIIAYFISIIYQYYLVFLKIFQKISFSFIFQFLFNVVLSLCIYYFVSTLNITINSYEQFIIYGFVFLLLFSLIIIVLNILLNIRLIFSFINNYSLHKK